MKPALAVLGRSLGVAAAVGGYALLSHRAASTWAGTNLGAAIALAPLLAVAGGLAWRALPRGLFALLLAGVAAALALEWSWLRGESAWLSFLPHIGMNAMLGWFFGRTLRPGQTPLITQFASLVHRDPAPEVLRHTRQATLAWTLFFAADATVSALLFAFAPLGLWSAFANLATLPLVGAMFLAEYLVRVVRIPRQHRSSLADSVRAYFRANAEGKAPSRLPGA